MENLKNWDSFLNEGFDPANNATTKVGKAGEKVKRIATGTHAGFDPKEGAKYPLTALGQKSFDRIVTAWDNGKGVDQAAEILRSIIIKERDMQLKMGVAAIVAGVSLAKIGIVAMEEVVKEVVPTPDEIPAEITPAPDGGEIIEMTVKKGEGISQFMNRGLDSVGVDTNLGPDATLADLKTVLDNHVDGGVDALKTMVGDSEANRLGFEKLAKALESNPDTNLAEFFKNNLSGTGKDGSTFVTKIGQMLKFKN